MIENTCDGATAKACAAIPSILIPLHPGAAEVLRQLFFNGPTWDGDIITKDGRSELFRQGLAGRRQGWTYLTESGVVTALGAAVDRQKERRERERFECDRAKDRLIAKLRESAVEILNTTA
jgi:hypothetical protein